MRLDDQHELRVAMLELGPSGEPVRLHHRLDTFPAENLDADWKPVFQVIDLATGEIADQHEAWYPSMANAVGEHRHILQSRSQTEPDGIATWHVSVTLESVNVFATSKEIAKNIVESSLLGGCKEQQAIGLYIKETFVSHYDPASHVNKKPNTTGGTQS